MLLHVKYPESYPDEAPILELSAPRNAPEHPYFDLDDDAEELLAGLSETIEENMGMAMVFTLVSTLKDNAEQLIAKRQQAERDRHEERLLALEREENKKFHGTPVTPETFASWREGYGLPLLNFFLSPEIETLQAKRGILMLGLSERLQKYVFRI
jgi:hypothetical protein